MNPEQKPVRLAPSRRGATRLARWLVAACLGVAVVAWAAWAALAAGAHGPNGRLAVAGLTAAWSQRGNAASSAFRAGYPPPKTATPRPAPTAAPDPAGRFPPPAVPYEITTFGQSPHARLLSALRRALDTHDSRGIAGWIADQTGGIPVDRPGGDTEGYGTRFMSADLEAALDSLFAQGSQPVMQGYFEAPSCGGAGSGTCWPWVVITGWSGTVGMPPRPPAEDLGPPPPGALPLAASAWELLADVDGPRLRGWWIGDGYDELVHDLSAGGWGTYYVLR